MHNLGRNSSDITESDEVLGERLAAKDVSALYAIQDRYLERLTVFILKELRYKFKFGTMEDAEEIASETLFKVWETYDSERGSSLKTWLYWLAKQNIYRFLRNELAKDKGSQEQRESQSLMSEYDPILQEAVRELFENLTPEHQLVLWWKVVEKRTFHEIAEIISQTESTVKSRYYRILKELKTTLEVRDFLIV